MNFILVDNNFQNIKTTNIQKMFSLTKKCLVIKRKIFVYFEYFNVFLREFFNK